MNSRCGAAPTQTPPKPDFQAADQVQPFGEDLAACRTGRRRRCPRRSGCDPCLCPRDADRIGVGLGDPEPAAIVDRHRDRLHDVGLAGGKRHLKPSGTTICLAASSGGKPANGIFVGLRIGWPHSGNSGLVACNRKSSKLMCPQPPLLASTRRMKISLPSVRTQVDDHRLERFGVVARSLEDHAGRCRGAPVRRGFRGPIRRRCGSWRRRASP